jgi:nucleotide-binding universal stress UspA family protein
MSSAASTRRSGGKSGSTRGLPEPAIEHTPSPARKLGIKHLLVCVDGTDMDRAVLGQALPITLRFGSHIDVLHVRFDVHGTSMERQERQIDRLLDKPVEQLVAESAARARGHFEAWHAQCKLPLRDRGTAVLGPSTAWREITGYEDVIIARAGRLCDLIVVARKGARASTFSAMALETALFETGRPVLMVPAGTPANLFHRPLIAWNGSREAARAVGLALPFLTECEGGVEVFAAGESKHHGDSDELLRYLSWHGIVGEPIAPDEARATGVSLLARAEAHHNGLIVMGAYTHGHYRQFLFGGMTRHVMEHATIPVLFAH